MSGTRTQTVTTTAPAGTRLRRTAVQQTRAYDHLYDTTYTTGAGAHARANAAATNTRTVRVSYYHEWPISVLSMCNPPWPLIFLELVEQRGQKWSHETVVFFVLVVLLCFDLFSWMHFALSHGCVTWPATAWDYGRGKVYNVHLLCGVSTTPYLACVVPRRILFSHSLVASACNCGHLRSCSNHINTTLLWSSLAGTGAGSR